MVSMRPPSTNNVMRFDRVGETHTHKQCDAIQAQGKDVASRSVQKEVVWHGQYGGVMKGEMQPHDSEQVLLCVRLCCAMFITNEYTSYILAHVQSIDEGMESNMRGDSGLPSVIWTQYRRSTDVRNSWRCLCVWRLDISATLNSSNSATTKAFPGDDNGNACFPFKLF